MRVWGDNDPGQELWRVSANPERQSTVLAIGLPVYNVLCRGRKEDLERHRKGPCIGSSFIGQLCARYSICTVAGSV